jgi:hypothetical protein
VLSKPRRTAWRSESEVSGNGIEGRSGELMIC